MELSDLKVSSSSNYKIYKIYNNYIYLTLSICNLDVKDHF